MFMVKIMFMVLAAIHSLFVIVVAVAIGGTEAAVLAATAIGLSVASAAAFVLALESNHREKMK